MTLMNGNAPEFGSKIEEREALRLLAGMPDLDRMHRLEGQALRNGIEAKSIEDASQAAAQFVQLRRERQARYPEVAAFEQALEWTEGLARYADLRLMQLAGTGNASSIAYSDNTWRDFLNQLSNPASIRTGLRDRYAAFGAAQAFLLDRLTPDWKSRALPGGASLDNLVAQTIAQSNNR